MQDTVTFFAEPCIIIQDFGDNFWLGQRYLTAILIRKLGLLSHGNVFAKEQYIICVIILLLAKYNS